MNARASSIVIYLMFQKDYVSLQQLADLYFLSKTAVALELKTIERWVERNENIELEISTSKGLKLLKASGYDPTMLVILTNSSNDKNQDLKR